MTKGCWWDFTALKNSKYYHRSSNHFWQIPVNPQVSLAQLHVAKDPETVLYQIYWQSPAKGGISDTCVCLRQCNYEE